MLTDRALALLLSPLLLYLAPTAVGPGSPAVGNAIQGPAPAQATPSTDSSHLYLPLARHGNWYRGAVTFAVIGDYGVCARGEPV